MPGATTTEGQVVKPFPISTDWLRERAIVSPNAVALLIDEETLTFGELDVMVTRLADHLSANHVMPGDHVGLLLPNSLAAVCAIFALARLNAVLVPLNKRLTAIELAWQVSHSGCAHLLSSPQADTLARAASGSRPLHLLPDRTAEFVSWVSQLPRNKVSFRPSTTLDSLQAIVFTSGTTGFPKGAMITYANHFWSATASAFRLGVHVEDRWLACLPLNHVGGLAILFRSCLYGTAIELHEGFRPEAILHSLATKHISVVSLVPTMLSRLLQENLSIATTPKLRLALLGGAAAPPDLLEQAHSAGVPVAVTYGLTEAASQVATMLPPRVLGKPGSPGKSLIFTRIAIHDDGDQETAAYEPGEIVVASPTVMRGYYNDPAATANTIRGGWLHTGDIGYVDEDGDLWVLNRRSDLIISGGENIYPAEVERVLREHPAVDQVCVVGIPHPDWGQQVAALVTTHPDCTLTGQELLAFSRERLAGYKQPRVLQFTDQMPLTTSGKIHRQKVVTKLSASLEPERP